jgi:hypothetical protein
MANGKGNAAPQGADERIHSEGPASISNISFAELADWVKDAEEINPNIRIVEVSSSDADTPESLVLRFSHPVVVSGVDGYTLNTGAFVAFEKGDI